MSTPQISVIIPTYNCGGFIVDAIRSVMDQSFRNFEVIVVDDGSTDDTVKNLAKFRDRIHYVYHENKGLPAALNTGIRSSRGEFLAILDADDLWHEDKLQEQAAAFEACPELGLCYTNFSPFGAPTSYSTGFDEREGSLTCYAKKEIRPNAYKITVPELLEELLLRQASPKPSTVMLRRKCLERIGLFDETLTFCQDTQMWFRMAKYHSVGYVDRCLVYRRIRADSLGSSQTSRQYIMEHIRMFENLGRCVPLTAKEEKIAHRILSGYRLAAGYSDFCDYRLISSRQHFWESLKSRLSAKAMFYLMLSFFPTGVLKVLRTAKQLASA